jgi:two-component system sensor histidine kinase/response regulator
LKISRESTPIDIELEYEIRELLATRLVAESPLSELAHPALAIVAGAMLWPYGDHSDIVSWVAAIAIAAFGRAYLRRRAALSRDPAASRLQAIRIGVATLGVAWGLGMFFLSVGLPPAPLAWVTVIFAGLVAGATTSLLPDPPSFYILTSTLLLPLSVGVGRDSAFDNKLAVFVVLLFGGAMSIFFQRAHRALIKQFFTAKRLELTERAAGNERRLLDTLIEGAPSAIAVVSEQGTLLRANKSFETVFGWTPANILNRPLNDLVVFPEDLEEAKAIDVRVNAGEKIGVEVRRKRKDGTAVWVRISAATVTIDDSRVTFVIYADVTEARRAREGEARLAQIVEATTDHIGVLGLDGKRRYLNAAGREMLGFSKDENVVGMEGNEIIPPRLREWALDKMRDVIKTGTWTGEMAFIHRDGHEVPVSIVALAQRDASGKVDSVAAVARDITGEVAARNALREARDVAEEATRAKSAFLANTSHEIRTPLNGILGMVELLLDTELTAAQRRSTELIASSGETLLATINDLLDLSKIEANQLELEEITFDLHHVLHSAVRLFMPRADENSVELVSDVASDVPQHVRGDPHRLRQVLSNLVGNAVKFTHDGDVVLTARREDGDRSSRIVISIKDTGIGIAQANIDRIFEPFRQVDASTTRQYGGTGLGLSIARRLVELMGGALRVDSVVGKGSEFSFTLNLAAAPAPATEHSREMGLEGIRVLVVDDHPINRRTICDMLRWAGAEVTDASSASSALTILRKAAKDGTPFKLVISDVQMPERDGFQLAGDIRADVALHRIRVMLLTSVGRRGDGQRSREVGVAAYMMKPVSRVELVEAALAAMRDTGGASLVTRHTIDEARRHMRVLLTEDNPVNQEVASTMLRKRGHEVTIADDGQVAVDIIKRGDKFDVILMDLQMPQLDGHLATKEIRAFGCETPIVALTANALEGERDRCLANGMSAYLSKPFKAHELFAVVEGWDTPAPAPSTVASAEGPPVDMASFTAMLAEAGIESAGDQMLRVFLDYAAERGGMLRAAVERGDYNEAERIAHALKSSAGTIMATSLADLLKKMEAAARAADVAQVRELNDAISAEHARVMAFLKEKLP